MLDTLRNSIPRDRDLPERAHRIDFLGRVLAGTAYDGLPHEFHEERTAAGEYIPLRMRRPSVRYNLARIVVEDSVSLLFGEGRFPTVDLGSTDATKALREMLHDLKLPAVMQDAAHRGSVGSVCLRLRVLGGRLFVDALDTAFLTPEFDPQQPDTLARVRERYKVKGSELAAVGYTVAPDMLAADHWFCRDWDSNAETWYLPQPCADGDGAQAVDTSRTVQHALGFVPMVWVRNLPNGPAGVDGACTFEQAIPTQIEIDYQLSQAGRGLRYSSDPTLLIKEPAVGEAGEIIRGGGNALVVSENGDARMLEINGTAAAAVIEYVRALREMALESVHGNRSNADKVSAAQSGRAMEMMHQALICLADRLRESYGNGALVDVVHMICAISQKMPLRMKNGARVLPLSSDQVSLKWPAWFDPTESDLQSNASALSTLRTAGLVSRETGVKHVAAPLDVHDTQAEIAAIEADEAAADARLATQAAQVQARETVEE